MCVAELAPNAKGMTISYPTTVSMFWVYLHNPFQLQNNERKKNIYTYINFYLFWFGGLILQIIRAAVYSQDRKYCKKSKRVQTDVLYVNVLFYLQLDVTREFILEK